MHKPQNLYNDTVPTRNSIISIFIILATVTLTVWAFPRLPNTITTHWNSAGQPDGTSSKAVGLALIPLVQLGVSGFYALMLRIDPQSDRLKKFQSYYYQFLIITVLFLGYLQGVVIAWNSGWQFNLVRGIAPAIALLFYTLGQLLKKTEPNWTVGIRTPWTMSNEVVWRKTHQVGSVIVKAFAIVLLITSFLSPQLLFYVLIGGAVFLSVGSMAYSYYLYSKLNH